MKRLVVITVGKTHSGKSTFAQALEQQLHESLVIDQDNHAEFLGTYYRRLLPKQGPNTIKYSITRAIVDHAVRQTDAHLILCNSNSYGQGRSELLEYFHKEGFISILVYFDLPDLVLEERVAHSQRSKTIFRAASSFKEVLDRQQYESLNNPNVTAPAEGEANHLLVIKNSDEVREIIRKIVTIANN
ncbi:MULTISPECIES: ATP-binding protein [Paenibacillus]|uniref:CRISPR-associated endoribonuclease Cas2 n=1 Tax=Paenibacillus vini TaxID=1476024 RepID=A0ABQ4MJ62_9BACL|nr:MULTISPECIES: ATP-binding protein [Paenibacillus]MBQ4897885.1 ATP-binding protein [Paenibacillus sp. Marseille-P2973]GIP56029.1 CRISPR-associated endoribonuclease Cas2 [Paenibacillus vini]